jgi:hypothetical protein
MIAKIITILSILINSFYFMGNYQHAHTILEYTKEESLDLNITFFGLYWPTIVWGIFIAIDVVYLLYLIKVGKLQHSEKRYFLLSVILLVVPFLVSYFLGIYFTGQFINNLENIRRY